jgi:putative inorganic carbon (HCO3(-)) transporter
MSDSVYVATPRHRPSVGVRTSFLPAAAGGSALLLGILAAIHPELALPAMIGLILVPIIFARPIVGLCALVFLSFLETYSALSGVVSATKIVGAILVLTWLGFAATSKSRHWSNHGLLSREPLLAATLLLLIGWAAASLAWAEVPATARSSVIRFGLNFALFPIALVAIRTRQHVLWLVGTFVAGAFTAVALGLLDGSIHSAASEDRLTGAGLNPNQLGTYLAAVVLVAATLTANRRWSPTARAAAAAVTALGGVAVLMTLSRGALVGLAAALVLAPLAIGRGRRGIALLFVIVAVIGSVSWYTAFAPAGAVERVTHPEQGGGTGREDMWRVGWRIVEDRPFVGVGAGNFPEASIHYLLRPGSTQNDENVVDKKKVAHNIYLTVLSELGTVGFALFALILGQCLVRALQAARRFEECGDLTMELVARGLFLALVSFFVADFFSSALYSKQLWVLLAIAPALLVIAERPAVQADARVTFLPRRQSAFPQLGG